MSVNQKNTKRAKSLLTFTYTEQTQGLQRHGSVTMKVRKVINYTSRNANYTNKDDGKLCL